MGTPQGAVSTKLTNLIQDMNRLETELGSFERRFGQKSAEFYEAMNNGELKEFDGWTISGWNSSNGCRCKRLGVT